MKMPLECPFCSGPMINDFAHVTGVQQKRCDKQITHNVQLIARKGDNDTVNIIRIRLGPYRTIEWNLGNQICAVTYVKYPVKKTVDLLPFFMPDLTDYNSLMEKVNTYLLFL